MKNLDKSFLKELEKIIGESIPILDELETNPIGVKVENEKITKLKITNVIIDNIPASIKHLKHLRELNLSGCNLRFHSFPSERWKHLEKLEALKRIDLGYCKRVNIDFPIIKSLQYLNLRCVTISLLPLEHLTGLKCVNIEETDLEKYYIRDKSILTTPFIVETSSELEELSLQYKNNQINEEKIVDRFISIIENDKSTYYQSKCILLCSELDLTSERIGFVIEKALISGTSPVIRNAAAKVITKFPDRISEDLLNHIIENERYVLILNTLLNSLKQLSAKWAEQFQEKLYEFVSNKYGIILKEAAFLWDLAVESLNSIRGGSFLYEKALTIEKNRIIEMSLASKYPPTKRVLTEIPESILNLSELEYLDIRQTKLIEIPQFIQKLPKLSKLEISHNSNLESILDWVYKFENSKEKFIKEGANEHDAEMLGRLDMLTTEERRIFRDTEGRDGYCTYGLDNDGNVTSLFIFEATFGKEIPTPIFELTHLKSLILDDCGILRISDNIGRLQDLEVLDIGGDRLEELPKGLLQLKNLKDLKLTIKLKHSLQIFYWFFVIPPLKSF